MSGSGRVGGYGLQTFSKLFDHDMKNKNLTGTRRPEGLRRADGRLMKKELMLSVSRCCSRFVVPYGQDTHFRNRPKKFSILRANLDNTDVPVLPWVNLNDSTHSPLERRHVVLT